MYKQCTTEQSASRQRELVEGMLEALTRQHYDEITVSGLCQQLQIPRKSFYRYFSSKEGALHALIDYALLDFESFQTSRKKESTLTEEMERIFAYWMHRKKLLDALEKSNLSGILVQRAIGHSVLENKKDRPHLPAEEQQAMEYFMLFAVTGLMSMVIQWHRDGYPQSVKQMADIASRLVTRPMASDIFSQ